MKEQFVNDRFPLRQHQRPLPIQEPRWRGYHTEEKLNVTTFKPRTREHSVEKQLSFAQYGEYLVIHRWIHAIKHLS